MKTTYTIMNSKNSERYDKEFENDTEARHWVINHLDTSIRWSILRQKTNAEQAATNEALAKSLLDNLNANTTAES